MTAPYASGHCGIGRCDSCAGAYAGTACQHHCHQPPPPPTEPSEHCRSWQHDRCTKPCACHCHEQAARFAEAAAFGADHDVPAQPVRDLVAHLQSNLDLALGLPRAVLTAQLVIDLGWRP